MKFLEHQEIIVFDGIEFQINQLLDEDFKDRAEELEQMKVLFVREMIDVAKLHIFRQMIQITLKKVMLDFDFV